MANDPRRFTKEFCKRQREKRQNVDAEQADFFGALQRLGGLEAWKDIGFGKVGEGLRALTGVANSVRLGENGTAIPDAINAGGRWVLDACSVPPSSFNSLASFQPGVANRAVDAAKQVWRRTKDGNFSLRDIPNYFSNIQNAYNLATSIFGGDQKGEEAKNGAAGLSDPDMCSPSPFAMDLIRFAPKYKFLFIVDIKYTQPYQDWQGLGDGLAFVVLNSTRPNFSVDYEEVNMYNFRTQVPTRTKFEPMSMRFYDDNMNNGQLFYSSYMRAVSPLSNLKHDEGADGTTDFMQARSMDFARPNKINTFKPGGPKFKNEYAASLGTLLENRTSIIKTIKLFHVFQYGALMNVFTFHNPRMSSIELDDLDMSESGPTELSINFEYDKLFVESGVDIKKKEFGYDIEQLSSKNVAILPLNPTFREGEDVAGEKQPEAPTAQQQEDGGDAGIVDSAMDYVNNAIDAAGNITNGIKDKANEAWNSGINTATGIASNAFQSAKNFGGSFFQ